jgi:hypothetical protein
MSEEIVTIRKKFLPGKDAKETEIFLPLGCSPRQAYIQYKYKGIYNMKYDYEVVKDGFVEYERYIVSMYNNE